MIWSPSSSLAQVPEHTTVRQSRTSIDLVKSMFKNHATYHFGALGVA